MAVGTTQQVKTLQQILNMPFLTAIQKTQFRAIEVTEVFWHFVAFKSLVHLLTS